MIIVTVCSYSDSAACDHRVTHEASAISRPVSGKRLCRSDEARNRPWWDEIDLPKAAEYLQRAAAKNVPEAEARLAYWINNGVGGLARDHVKAEQWAKKALADGLAAKAANSAEAQTELATLYEFGLGAPKDLAESSRTLSKSGPSR